MKNTFIKLILITFFTFSLNFSVLASSWETNTWSSDEEVSIQKEFSLKNIKPISFTKFELEFSDELDSGSWAAREFRIIDKNDELDEFYVLENELSSEDQTRLTITLDREVTINNIYEIFVIELYSKDWNSIEQGINSISTFTINEDTFKETEKELEILENTWATQEEQIEEELNSAKEENLESTWAVSENSWKDLKEEEVEKNTLSEAKNNTKLPTTWPEHILMLLLALSLTGFVFLFRFKRD
jgi:hypothetical protein